MVYMGWTDDKEYLGKEKITQMEHGKNDPDWVVFSITCINACHDFYDIRKSKQSG